jgi:DNA-binding NarL/FixJ family response regulator
VCGRTRCCHVCPEEHAISGHLDPVNIDTCLATLPVTQDYGWPYRQVGAALVQWRAMGTRLVIADDDVFVRAGLESLLSDIDDFEVVGACGSLDELLAAVDRHGPDVVVTDIRMPPTHTDEGIAAAQQLRTTHPGVAVIALSLYLEPAYALRLLDDGSARRGYLLKDHVDDVALVERAIRAVATGGSFVDDDVVNVLLRRRSASATPLARLTARESEILHEVATGKSNTAVAASLTISSHAVEKHINSIFSKLGLENDPEANRRVQAVLMFLAGQ